MTREGCPCGGYRMSASDLNDIGASWYHGSPQRLTTLRAGSSISQHRNVASAFSHRPTLVSQGSDGMVKHDGILPGYLYRVAEKIGPDDLSPHPHPVNVGHWEWLTRRPLRVELLEVTAATAADRLIDAEIAALRRKQAAAGAETFADAPID